MVAPVVDDSRAAASAAAPAASAVAPLDPVDPKERLRHQLQVAAIIGIVTVVMNVLFVFLSKAYFADRARRFGPLELDSLGSSRLHFAVFTGIVALAAIAAVLRPRIVALVITGLISVAAFFGAAGAISRDLPVVLPASGIVLGCILPVLGWFAHTRSRAAWAALASTMGVLSVVMLFGAPRVRGLLGGGLWTAMIIPGLLGVGLAALILIRGDYAEGTQRRD